MQLGSYRAVEGSAGMVGGESPKGGGGVKGGEEIDRGGVLAV